MAKYRKKPVVIEAVEWTGENVKEMNEFFEPHLTSVNGSLLIKTLEGDMMCGVGDFLIKGVAGEFYPCKPDIFEKTYELVD